MTMSSDQRQRERTSFKDIAKLAATPPPSSAVPSNPWGVAPPDSKLNPNDSGMVDLKLIAALDPRGAERAKSTPLAAAGLFEEDPAPARISAPPPSAAPVSAAPSSGVAAFAPSLPSLPQQPPMVAEAVPASMESMPSSLAPASAQAAPQSSVAPSMSAQAMLAAQPTAKKRGGVLIALFGGVVALSAAAAGGVFYMRHHKAPAPVAAAPAEQPAVVAAAPVVPPTPVAPAVAATDDQAQAPQQEEVAIDDTAKTAGKPAVKARHHGKTAAAPEEKVAAAPVAEAPTKPEPKVKFAPTGGGGDLSNAMKAAAGPIDGPAPTDDKPTGPQFAPGSVPQKPANGAVQGAIGAVLPNARACLGPDDPVSRATIVFGSLGSVQSVSISGGAAGKPEEKCIKQALGRAKVQPFAEPTFTTSFTVRP